jgi:hypothetical protein
LTTWTPHALASESRPYAAALWRVVESQYVASTMRLVDSLAEQALLESLLEDSKPPLPAGSGQLHYLLYTPFRYRSRFASRFRAPFEAGVWYGAEALRTALAEKSFWQLRFLLDSPQMPDLGPVPHTAFTAAVRGSGLDLTASPLAAGRERWTDRADYTATQALAAVAREAGIALIRYESVRDPERAACVAVLSPDAFARVQPRQTQTWVIAASRTRVRCAPTIGLEPAARVAGGRLATMWEFSREQLTGETASA